MIIEPQEMYNLAERMRRNWVDQGIPINPGLGAPEIALFESSHKIHLPEEFTIYLGVVNGMATVDMDKDWFTFKALQDMSVWDGKLTFADSCLESAIFCLALDPAWAPFLTVFKCSVKGNQDCRLVRRLRESLSFGTGFSRPIWGLIDEGFQALCEGEHFHPGPWRVRSERQIVESGRSGGWH